MWSQVGQYAPELGGQFVPDFTCDENIFLISASRDYAVISIEKKVFRMANHPLTIMFFSLENFINFKKNIRQRFVLFILVKIRHQIFLSKF